VLLFGKVGEFYFLRPAGTLIKTTGRFRSEMKKTKAYFIPSASVRVTEAVEPTLEIDCKTHLQTFSNTDID